MARSPSPAKVPTHLSELQAERVALGLPPLPESAALSSADTSKPWTESERARLTEFRTDGLSLSAIAERLSRTVPEIEAELAAEATAAATAAALARRRHQAENPSAADKERMKAHKQHALRLQKAIKAAMIWSIENSSTWTEAGFLMEVSWETMQNAGEILGARLRRKAKGKSSTKGKGKGKVARTHSPKSHPPGTGLAKVVRATELSEGRAIELIELKYGVKPVDSDSDPDGVQEASDDIVTVMPSGRVWIAP
jgi:hypothetical protein